MGTLLHLLLTFWSQFVRCEVISGHGDVTPYLIRYHLVNNRFFKVYLHYFLRSDLDDPHCHPWNFATLMLRGAYTEELYDWRTRAFTRLRRTPTENALIFRKAEDTHRVVVDKDLSRTSEKVWKKKAASTLFFAARKTKEWGFVENYKTGPRWKLWSEYLKEKKNVI